MSNYTKTTNFAVKDSLASGNPAKIIKGSEINAEYDDAWHNKGLTLFRLGRYEESLAAFGKALEINPNDPVSLKYRDELMKKLKG